MAGKYLTLLNADEVKRYVGEIMGLREYTKDSSMYVVDDNYTNRLVLGMPVTRPRTILSLEHEEGLLPFQVEDVLRMVNTRGFLNANRMGTGKTVETIMACRNLNAKSILIVCPKAVIGQWVAQLCKWWPERSKDIHVYELGDMVARNGIYITNYEKVVNKKSDGKFTSFVWDVLALDEAHYIKNRNAQRTKACKAISARFRYALTGTPILKTPDDLFSILEFLDPVYTGRSYWNFVNYYCNVHDGYFGKEITGLTKVPTKINRLNKLLEAVSCRRGNNDIAHGKQDIHVNLIMSKEQTKLYDRIRKLILAELPQELTIPNGAVMLTRLIQTTSAPGIFNSDAKKFPVGVKFEWLYEQLVSNDEKFVVFSRMSEVVNTLQKYLEEAGVGCVRYTGSMSSDAREASKNTFVNDPDCRVIAGTIGALGTGVDELQKASHICVFIDRDFSPEINAQCEDRLHRMGQQQPVLCYYLECAKTIDKKIDNTTFKRAEDIRRALND